LKITSIVGIPYHTNVSKWETLNYPSLKPLIIFGYVKGCVTRKRHFRINVHMFDIKIINTTNSQTLVLYLHQTMVSWMNSRWLHENNMCVINNQNGSYIVKKEDSYVVTIDRS